MEQQQQPQQQQGGAAVVSAVTIGPQELRQQKYATQPTPNPGQYAPGRRQAQADQETNDSTTL